MSIVSITQENIANQILTGNQIYSSITALPDGRLVVVWEDDAQDGDRTGVFGRILAADGTPIGAEFQINQNTESHQDTPEVVALSDGGFVVAWNDEDPDFDTRYDAGYGQFRIYNSDGTARTDEILSVSPALAGTSAAGVDYSNAFHPTVIATDDGGFILIGREYNYDGGYSLYGTVAQIFDENGNAVTDEVDLLPENADDFGAGIPAGGARLSDGSYVVAQLGNGDGGGDIFFTRFTVSLLDGIAIDTDHHLEQVNFHYDNTDWYNNWVADVAALSDGFVVTYTGFGGVANGWDTLARVYNNDGTARTDPFHVDEPYDHAENKLPDVVGLADGSFVLVWMYDDTYEDVFIQHYNADGSKNGDVVQVSSDDAFHSIAPVVAALPDGGFAVSWSDWDGSDSNIMVRTFQTATDMVGSDGNDTINGRGRNEVIKGYEGDDRLNGWGGNDRLEGDDGSDVLVGGGGIDELFGGDENDTLHGNLGGDFLFGEAGDDTLNGGVGDDYMDGGAGDDVLIGHLGQDTFVFSQGADIVRFFVAGDDKIDLSSEGAISDFADLTANHMTQVGRHVVIDNGSDTMTLQMTDLSDLTSDNFLF